MKKLIFVAIMMMGCVGSDKPRNPMGAQPAPVTTKVKVKRCATIPPPIEMCEEHKH